MRPEGQLEWRQGRDMEGAEYRYGGRQRLEGGIWDMEIRVGKWNIGSGIRSRSRHGTNHTPMLSYKNISAIWQPVSNIHVSIVRIPQGEWHQTLLDCRPEALHTSQPTGTEQAKAQLQFLQIVETALGTV